MEEISEHNHVKYVRLKSLDDTGLIRHGFSARVGGVSSGVYASLNLSYTQGDDPAKVTENIRRMADCLGLTPERIVRARQTHTINIRRVGLVDAGSGVVRDPDFQDVDGLITDEPGIWLNTLHADCTPIFLLDSDKKAIGMIHAGWKGTTGRIASEAIKSMQREFGSDPEDIMAYIGPCISAGHYEVGMDVALSVIEAFGGSKARESFLTGKGREEIIKNNELFKGDAPVLKIKAPAIKSQKFYFDLREANKRILLQSGLREDDIFVSDLCTYERDELFYSHRRMGKKRGLMGAFIGLR